MNKPLILGHRGYSGLYPENTPLAFIKAADTRQNASFAIKLPSKKEAQDEQDF